MRMWIFIHGSEYIIWIQTANERHNVNLTEMSTKSTMPLGRELNSYLQNEFNSFYGFISLEYPN